LSCIKCTVLWKFLDAIDVGGNIVEFACSIGGPFIRHAFLNYLGVLLGLEACGNLLAVHTLNNSGIGCSAALANGLDTVPSTAAFEFVH